MNIEELKRLAGNALPCPNCPIGSNSAGELWSRFVSENGGLCLSETARNFIAAANPAAVLELIRQRDELLAALREIAEWTERYTTPGHPISTAARAVIAKVEG